LRAAKYRLRRVLFLPQANAYDAAVSGWCDVRKQEYLAIWFCFSAEPCLNKHSYITEARSFRRHADAGVKFGRRAGALPAHCPGASDLSVLALYPATTTELPFT